MKRARTNGEWIVIGHGWAFWSGAGGWSHNWKLAAAYSDLEAHNIAAALTRDGTPARARLGSETRRKPPEVGSTSIRGMRSTRSLGIESGPRPARQYFGHNE